MKTRSFCSYSLALFPIERWESLLEGPASSGVLVLPDGSPAPKPIGTRVMSCHTQSDLFVLFEGRFVTLRSIGTPDGRGSITEGLWERSDVYELFIGRDARRTGRYFEFQLGPDGRYLALAITHEGGSISHEQLREESFSCASLVDTSRHLWRGFFRIPWSLLTGQGPCDNLECNAFRASGKFHGDELLTLSPTGRGEGCFHRYQYFISLELLTEPSSLLRETP